MAARGTSITPSVPARNQAGKDLSCWDELLWEQEFDYEVRSLKLVTRCISEEQNRILCGDKSGRITAFRFTDGTPEWNIPPREEDGHRLLGGPIYDFAVVHRLLDADEFLDPARDSCLIAVGDGNGELTFLNYIDGRPISIAFEEGPESYLDLKSGILALLYIESRQELWAGLASGEIARLRFEFDNTNNDQVIRGRRLSSLDLGEAVSSLCFMPRCRARSGDEFKRGWICAATMLGNVYPIDPTSTPPHREGRLFQANGPIRSCVSLSSVASRYGWENRDVFAVAYGGAVKYFIREWSQDEQSLPAPESVLDWSCADRVFCLGWVDFKDAVWLVAGANDNRLHFSRIMSRETMEQGQGLSHRLGDKRFVIRLEERVREVAVREVPGGTEEEMEANVYVALGNHKLQALRLLSPKRFRERIQNRYQGYDLQGILDLLDGAPYDLMLRREVIALLFWGGWLSEYLRRPSLDRWEKRCLRLIVYQLLVGSSPAVCRRVLAGILDAANRCNEFQATATDLARHIGKYCLDGDSFSDKRQNLDRLARFNEQNDRDYLYDAAIYRSLLAERRHTERQVFELGAPITSLQAVELPKLGGRRLLATSYQRGAAWLLEKKGHPRLKLSKGAKTECLQKVVVWTDPINSAQHAVLFYRDFGWTSLLLDTLEGASEALDPLPVPRPVLKGKEKFYIYSFYELPGGLVAIGGRCSDVRLLRIAANHDGRDLSLHPGPAVQADPSNEYAPIWSLYFRPLDDGSGELFAGCDNGVCYCFPFDGSALGEPYPVYRAPIPAAIRVMVPQGSDRLIVGDTSDSLALLRRLEPSSEPPDGLRKAPDYLPEWNVRLGGAAITGIVETTLLVPDVSSPSSSPRPRPVYVVSDSLGKFHILRLDEIREHSFAELLNGASSSPIEQMVSFPPEEPRDVGDQAQVAVACFDQTVRILQLFHRRESVRHLNDDLSQVIVAMLRSALPDSPPEPFKDAGEVLRKALHENLFVVDIIQLVACALATSSASASQIAQLVEEVRGVFDEVSWKLASVRLRSESLAVMSLRLRYDDPQTFPRLLDELSQLSSGAKGGPEGRRPHLRLRYCLRFAFKIVAHLLDSGPPPELRLLARFVHVCYDLCQNWGPDQSDDELRCKLVVSHMLFRFARRRTLEYLLGDELNDELKKISGQPMSRFLQERLLNDSRLAIPFRSVQQIRRMVIHDTERTLERPVLDILVGLLVGRFRQCQNVSHDGWLGMEIYLCLHSIEKCYNYSQWELVSQLLEHGCSLPLLKFLAERQRVLPPKDERCQDVVVALNQVEGVSADETWAAEARHALFDRLSDKRGKTGILACVRVLTAVVIAFDSSSALELRQKAHHVILETRLESLTFPPALSAVDMEKLLDCARGLIELPAASSGQARKELYGALQRSLDRLITLRSLDTLDAGLFEADVIQKIFLEGRDLVRRQVEIEFDFVAPLRFLQEHSEITDEQTLTRELLSYAEQQVDLSRSGITLLLTRDATKQAVVLYVLREGLRSREVLSSRGQIRRRLPALLPPASRIDILIQEAALLLDPDSKARGAARLDLFELNRDQLGELISIDREGEIYGLLFFAYDRTLAPDPSKRALVRTVPQLLVLELIRSVQTQRLLSLTFHHISAPIAAMRRMLKNIKAGYIEPDEQKKYLENLWLIAEDCRLMIENHQNYVRMSRGIKSLVSPKKFDLTAEAEFRRKIVHYKYKDSHQILRWDPDPEPLEVFLDPVLVGDIIQNLLDNACKYSPTHTEIKLSVHASRREVLIEVSDQGPGLPESVFVSLYGEGVRGDMASQSTKEGLGLGLFMVRSYVEWLDGRVWSDSSPETGTTFTVSLPREVRQR